MFHNGLATARRVARVTRWLADQASALDDFADRWLRLLEDEQ